MKIENILRYVVLAGIFAVPLTVPFLVSSTMFFPFITGKGFAFRIITEIIFACWFILALRDKAYRPRFSWIAVGVAGFLAILLVADIFAENPQKAFWSNYERMEGFVSILHFGLYFFVAGSTLITEKLWNWFLHTPIATAIALFFYSMLQLKGELVINQGGVRLDGTLGNATYLAGFLAVVIFLVLLFWSRRHLERLYYITSAWLVGSGIFILYHVYPYLKKVSNAPATSDPIPFFYGQWSMWLFVASVIIVACGIYTLYTSAKWKLGLKVVLSDVIYALTAIVLFIPLYNTATRGAMLGVIGGLFLTAVIVIFGGKGAPLLRKIAIGVAIFVAVSSVLFVSLRNSDFVKNNATLERLTSISAKSDDAQARFMVWNMAWQGFKERPILGWGQEGFNYVFNKYYDPKMYLREQWFDRTHNVFFDWLIAGGVLGLLGYLSLIIFAIIYVWGKAPHFMQKKMAVPTHHFTVTEKALLTGLISAYFFQNFFVFDNVVSYIMLFTILAYLHARSATPLRKFESAPIVSDADASRFYGPIIIVLLVVVIWFVNVRSIWAARDLIDALRPQAKGAMENLEYFKSALKRGGLGTQEIREQIVQAAANLSTSSDANITADIKSAFVGLAGTEMEKQIKEAPTDARTRVFLGSFYSIIGNVDGAITQMEEGLKLSPQKQVIKASLANLYLRAGDAQRATELMKSAYESAPQFTEVAVGYVVSAIYAGDNSGAESAIANLIEKGPIERRVLQAYFETKQESKALAVAKRALEAHPDKTEAYLTLAAVYMQTGARTSAVNILKEAIAKIPGFKEQGDHLISEIQAGRTP